MDFPLLPFIGFAIATSITPGPNNVMVAASAAHFGVRRTMPHMVGIAVGFAVMVVLAGLGLAAPLELYPALQRVMKVVGIIWLLMIAWQIARQPPPGETAARAPLGFFGAAAFQWINPKAWMMVLGMASAWVVERETLLPQVLWMGGVFLLVCLPCCLVWAAIGTGAAPFLATPARLRWFNVSMAALLVASLVPILVE